MKRAIKNSVFLDLFTRQEYLWQLYKAIHPEDMTSTIDDLQLHVIQNVLTDQQYNDISFLVGNRALILMEAQSNYTENIAVRMLLYAAELMKRYIMKNHIRTLGRKKVVIPKLELYCVCIEKKGENVIEMYGDENYMNGVEAKVQMIYNDEKGEDILQQYIHFTQVSERFIAAYGRSVETLNLIIDECIRENILRDYLLENRSEVRSLMDVFYTQEEATAMWKEELIEENQEIGKEKGLKIGRKEGLKLGREETIKIAVENLKKTDLSQEAINKLLMVQYNLDLETAQKYFSGEIEV